MRSTLPWFAALFAMVVSASACLPETRVEAPDSVSPWEFELPDPPSPSLAEDDIEAAINEALVVVMEWDVAALLNAYEQFFALADETCPQVSVEDEPGRVTTYWEGVCTTADGVSFAGFVERMDLDEWVIGPNPFTGPQVSMSSTIRNGEESWVGAGRLVDTVDWEPWGPGELRWRTRTVQGTFSAVGEGVPPDLPGSGEVQASFRAVSSYMTEEPARALEVSGGVSGLSGPVSAVTFDGVAVADTTRAYTCQGEPSGTFGLRAVDGQWYELVFHGPPLGILAEDQELCDGCGELRFRGETVDELCPDFTAVLDWGETPW